MSGQEPIRLIDPRPAPKVPDLTMPAALPWGVWIGVAGLVAIAVLAARRRMLKRSGSMLAAGPGRSRPDPLETAYAKLCRQHSISVGEQEVLRALAAALGEDVHPASLLVSRHALVASAESVGRERSGVTGRPTQEAVREILTKLGVDAEPAPDAASVTATDEPGSASISRGRRGPAAQRRQTA